MDLQQTLWENGLLFLGLPSPTSREQVGQDVRVSNVTWASRDHRAPVVGNAWAPGEGHIFPTFPLAFLGQRGACVAFLPAHTCLSTQAKPRRHHYRPNGNPSLFRGLLSSREGLGCPPELTHIFSSISCVVWGFLKEASGASQVLCLGLSPR